MDYKIIFIDNDQNPLVELCDKVCEKAFQRGLLTVHTGRESIKIGPPLSIPLNALDEWTKIIEKNWFDK